MPELKMETEVRFGDDFHLQVNLESKGPIIRIEGDSGSGKTTLLLQIAGLVAPQSGRISLGEKTFFDQAYNINLHAKERSTGCVFQENLLFNHLTVRGNLNYGRSRRGRHGESVEKWAQTLGLNEVLDRRVDAISGGQARRVAVGRAILSQPSILLLDEPWTGLDPEIRKKVVENVEAWIHRTGTPTLEVSHGHNQHRLKADQCFEIKAGKIDAIS